MTTKVTPEQETIICNLYLSGKSYTEISNLGLFSPSTIHRILKKNNIAIRSNHKLTTSQKNEIILKYENGNTIRSLAKEYNVCKNNIRQLLISSDLKIRSGSESLKLSYPIKENVFDTITEESAYWLGFLTVDGSMSGNRISLSLSIKDKGHLEKFRSFLGSKHKIIEVQRRNSLQVMLTINSQKLFNKLGEYGITSNKNQIVKINDSLKSNQHFWRGIIDGNGDLKLLMNKYPAISLIGNQIVCQQFSDYVKNVVPDSTANIYKTKVSYGFIVSAIHAVLMIKKLYQKCTIAIPRKLNKSQSYVTWECPKPINHQILECNGKSQSVNDWAKEVGICDYILKNRINRGWSIEDAIYSEDSETKDLYKLAENKGISKKLLKERLKKGFTIEQALMEKEITMTGGIKFAASGSILAKIKT